jgi:hypothetical protein
MSASETGRARILSFPAKMPRNPLLPNPPIPKHVLLKKTTLKKRGEIS